MNYLEYRRNLKLRSSSEKLEDRVSKDLSKKKPLPKKSAKRKEEDKLYAKATKELKQEQKGCQLRIKGVCIGNPTHNHHLEGRTGSNYHNKRKMVRACDPCNGWCVSHPTEAAALGFVLIRTGPSEKFSHLKKEKA